MQGIHVSWEWQMMQNLKRNWLVSSKLTWRIWRILTWALDNLKNLHFNELLSNKVHNVWAKKSMRGVLLDGAEYWCNIWRKSDLCFQKWHEEFSKFSPENVRKSENWNFDGILLSKVENVWAKIYREVLYHDNEEWCKIWREIDLSVQNWHEEFDDPHKKINRY